MIVNCAHQQECSGCQLLGTKYLDQLLMKKANLAQLLKHSFNISLDSISVLESGSAHNRDRFDFTIQDNKIGIYNKDKSQVVDIYNCEQLSPSLNLWFQEFRKFKFPIKKGSVRLRVSPNGLKGAWLDFANIDIKHLLEEKKLLNQLLEISVIEIGQKRKSLTLKSTDLKLTDPQFNPWFETFIAEQNFPLVCSVGSFTQPSISVNKKIQKQIFSWLQQMKPQKILEYGSGIGNLSLQLLHFSKELCLIETDILAIESFKINLQHFLEDDRFMENKNKTIKLETKLNSLHQNLDLLVVNPPRSGLGHFTTNILEMKPKNFLYMSCSPKTFAEDMLNLNSNFTLQEVVIIDQFPQTNHFEVLAWFKLN